MYIARLRSLISQISPEILPPLDTAPQKPRVPTQAFSEFLINRELGDWAEDLVRRGVNECGLPIAARRYGRAENLVAGEPGFAEFFRIYHEELKTLGKRPDLLIFQSADAPAVDFETKTASE